MLNVQDPGDARNGGDSLDSKNGGDNDDKTDQCASVYVRRKDEDVEVYNGRLDRYSINILLKI